MKKLDDILNRYNLSEIELSKIKEILNREPNSLELSIYSVLWSEHCSYKSSKEFIKNFNFDYDHVVQGIGENAGVIKIKDNYNLVFKIESHNYPSNIDPYNGSASGVGGIVRDIVSMGARPISLLNSLYFGEVSSKNFDLQKKQINHISRGISKYGNSIGVPNIGGSTFFDKSYNGSNLVNVFSLGIAKDDELLYSRAGDIGDIIVYLGAKTSIDGLGGAVMSSSHKGDNSIDPFISIAIANPFLGKLLLDGCLKLFDSDISITGMQDVGAGGIASALFDMAYKSDVGIDINCDNIPKIKSNMNPEEVILSETQERMLVSIKNNDFKKLKKIFDEVSISCEIIGSVNSSKSINIINKGKTISNIPVKSTIDGVITNSINLKKYSKLKKLPIVPIINDLDIDKVFLKLFKSLNILDKGLIYSQFDSSIQARSIKTSGELDASIIYSHECNVGIAISSSSNPYQSYIDPKKGAELLVSRLSRDIALAGGKAMSLTNCLNFGFSNDEDILWQLKESCSGIANSCSELGLSIVSGNVSLNNGKNDKSIYPTPTLVTVGKVFDYENIIDSKLKRVGNNLFLIGGIDNPKFGGSLLYKEVYNKITGYIDDVDFNLEKRLQKCLGKLYGNNLLLSSKNVGLGGVIISLAKMVSISNLGVLINPFFNDLNLFCENEHRAIVEVDNDEYAIKILNDNSIPYIELGTICDDGLTYCDKIRYSSKELKDIYFNSLKDKI